MIQYRWAHGEYDRLPALAAELVHAPVAVLVAVGGEPAARAALAATTSIPVVTVFGTDPVKSGLISSLSHPGGNVTGVSNLATAMEPKRVGLLRELVPQAKAFGALINPDSPALADQLADIQAAAQTTGVELHVFRAATDRDIEGAGQSAEERAQQMRTL